MKQKTYLNWSSGKDAALALYYLLQDEKVEVGHLLTSINSHHNRVSMHGLRKSILERQIDAVGLPSSLVQLPEQPDMERYEIEMEKVLADLLKQGFTHSAFGDIFLEDLRLYREEKLDKIGVKGCFPLWKRDTKELINEFIDLGFRAVVVCCSAELLDESFVGREVDHQFVADLPSNVDPCGENGEFHTFCFDGPIFNTTIEFSLGEVVFREYDTPNKKNHKTGFWFCDLF